MSQSLSSKPRSCQHLGTDLEESHHLTQPGDGSFQAFPFLLCATTMRLKMGNEQGDEGSGRCQLCGYHGD